MKSTPYLFSLILLLLLWLGHDRHPVLITTLYVLMAVFGFLSLSLSAIFVGLRKKLRGENGYAEDRTPYHLDSLCRISDKRNAIPYLFLTATHAVSLSLLGWTSLSVVFIIYLVFSSAVMFYLSRTKHAIMLECFE